MSIILPVKEPEPYLPVLIEQINNALEHNPIVGRWEILVQHERGLTNAVIAGVRRSLYDVIAVMDGDGQHNPVYLSHMLRQLQQHSYYKYDLVIGARKDCPEFPRHRRLISKSLNFAAKHLYQRPLSDAMTGYVVGYKLLFSKLKPSMSYKFLLQLLPHANAVFEVPITFQKRPMGKSKATFGTGVRALAQVASPIKFYIPVVAALLFSLALAITYLKPVGADIYFHWEIAQVWANGQLGMFSDVALNMNHMPYPPLLHLLLAPSFWLGLQLPWTLILQVILLPLCVYVVMKATAHLGRPYYTLAGFLVLGAFAFMDRLIQVQPQALTMVLFPLAFYYRKSPCKFITVSALMIWTHGLIAVPLLSGLWVFSLYGNCLKRRHIAIFAAVVAPIVVSSVVYIVGGVSHFFGSGYENTQEMLFWSSPSFTLLYMRFLLAGFPLVVYKSYQLLSSWSNMRKKPVISVDSNHCAHCLKRFFNCAAVSLFEREVVVTLLCMLPLLFWQADRFLQYSTIPLAFLIASYIKSSRFKVRETLFWITLIFFLFMYVTVFLMLVGNGFDVR